MMGGMGMMVSGSPAAPAGTVALSPSHSADDGPVLAVGDMAEEDAAVKARG